VEAVDASVGMDAGVWDQEKDTERERNENIKLQSEMPILFGGR
jgi:hypothetical protein